jgi:hypothetical protein
LKTLAFLCSFFFLLHAGFAQPLDTIFLKDSNKISCTLLTVNDSIIEYRESSDSTMQKFQIQRLLVDSIYFYPKPVVDLSKCGIRFAAVVICDSMRTKNALFDAALLWVNTYLPIAGKEATYRVNRDSARITSTSEIIYNLNFSRGSIFFTFRFLAYEGSYNYEFSGFFQEGSDMYSSYGLITYASECPPGLGPYQWGRDRKNQAWNEIKNKIRDVVAALAGSLTGHLCVKK